MIDRNQSHTVEIALTLSLSFVLIIATFVGFQYASRQELRTLLSQASEESGNNYMNPVFCEECLAAGGLSYCKSRYETYQEKVEEEFRNLYPEWFFGENSWLGRRFSMTIDTISFQRATRDNPATIDYDESLCASCDVYPFPHGDRVVDESDVSQISQICR